MKVSVILPVINETYSLTQTVLLIESNSEIYEYIVVVCSKTTEESMKTIQTLLETYPDKMKLLRQELPFIGGAMRDAFNACTGTHVIMMSSDLETDPNTVPKMIEESKKKTNAIITATRWKGKKQFRGYNPVKLVANWVFQIVVRVFYQTSLTDATFGFRLFPDTVVKNIRWEELKHPFFLETILKPILIGIQVIEVSSSWTARTEGESQNTFFRNFDYFRALLKYRFYTKESLLQKEQV